MFFSRSETGNLQFENLGFEILIDDILNAVKPKDVDELEWATRRMVDSLQVTVSDYARDTLGLEEWDDLYF